MLSDRQIDDIRRASRTIVREWGFLDRTLAGTGLSASAVHAVIEIGLGTVTASRLAAVLKLEKSTVSRLVKGLVADGVVVTTPSREDGRRVALDLTHQGRRLLQDINVYARAQVLAALNRLDARDVETVRSGLALYAGALALSDQADESNGSQTADMRFAAGYAPMLLGRVVTMHADFYSRHYGFGAVFEAKVAAELAEFLSRADRPLNEIWSATCAGEIFGSITLDGEDLGRGRAHLRWFVMDNAVRGAGAGKQLLSAAMRFVDDHGFKETHLWTFKGLDAARRLYEREGFVLVREAEGEQWGTRVLEQHFVR